MIFLVVYDTKAMKLAEEVREFAESDREEAMRALGEKQNQLIAWLSDAVEVALFESSDRATLERTHSRYFKSLSELGSELAKSKTRAN